MKTRHFLKIFTLLVVTFLNWRAEALIITNETAVFNYRFSSGGFTNPVLNTSPSFLGAGYDWSGVGWNPSTNGIYGPGRWGTAMVTPRNFMEANHFEFPAGPATFLNQNVQLVTTAVVQANYTVQSNDTAIATLASPNPSSSHIAVYSLLDPSGPQDDFLGARTSYLNFYVGQPVLMYGMTTYSTNNGGDGSFNSYVGAGPQVGSNFVSSVNNIVGSLGGWVWYFNTSATATTSNKVVGVNDSSNPSFIPFFDTVTGSNRLTILSTRYTTAYDTFIPSYSTVTNLNAYLAQTGYNLKWTGNPDTGWGGASNGNFATAANWTNGMPTSGYSAVFNGASAGGNRQIDLGGGTQQVDGFFFKAGAGAGNGFTFTNGGLTLEKIGLVNYDANRQTFNVPINFAFAQNWDGGAGGLTFNGAITNNGYLLYIEGTGTNILNGAYTGAGGLAKDGSGRLIVNGTNTLGPVFVHEGTLELASPYDFLGSLSVDGLGSLLMTNGQLVIGGVANVTGAVVLNGGQLVATNVVNVTGSVVVNGGQLVTTNNNVYLNGPSAIVVSNGTWLGSGVYLGVGSGPQSTLTIAGGTNVISSSLIVGHVGGETSAVMLAGGQLVTTNGAGNAYTYVGNVGVGNMTVSNGTWLADRVVVGANSGSVGTLTLAGGTNLFAGASFYALELGSVANTMGTVVMTGGQLVTTNQFFAVGNGGRGTVSVSNGVWLGKGVYVGAGGSGSVGTLTLAGGTNVFSSSVTVGYYAGSTAAVNVTGGNLIITNASGTAQLLVGRSGVGALTLNGGTVSADQLLVTNGASSAFTFNGGVLNAKSALIGAGSVFTVSNNGSGQVSGVITNAGTINVLNAHVVYNGNVVNQGAYVSDPSTNTFNGTFTVAPAATVTAAAGDAYAFGSNFVMSSTNRAFDMHLAQVVFSDTNYGITTGNKTHTFDLTGSGAVDMGSNGFMNVAQLATNFSIGTLSIAPSNNLTVTGTKTGSLTNALYVGWLDLSAWNTNAASLTSTLQAALNLTNINFYYDMGDSRNAYLQSASYALWGGGGMLVPVPEPNALMLTLAAGAFFVFILGRRRKA